MLAFFPGILCDMCQGHWTFYISQHFFKFRFFFNFLNAEHSDFVHDMHIFVQISTFFDHQNLFFQSHAVSTCYFHNIV